MQYLKMLPFQLREAIEKNTPVILPLGVIEYHAEHLPLGVDCFTCLESIDRLEKKHPEVIVLPPFCYGSASYAVAKPEGNGTVHVDSEHVLKVAEDIFRSLLRVGFRNIHGYIAHQHEEFVQGMPTDLAFRFAARRVIFEFLEKNTGEGWWGTEKFSAYYSEDNNPFNYIRIHPCLPAPERYHEFPVDQAGKNETSITLASHPETVHMDKLDNSIWYSRAGVEGSAEYGNASLNAIVEEMEKTLGLVK